MKAKAGRKRKEGVTRTASGRISRAGEIHPETLAVRERELRKDGIILSFIEIKGGRLVEERVATDRLSGYTLGRLYLRWQQDKGNPGGVSREQFEAGEAWASLAISRKSLDDSKRLGLKSQFANLVKSEQPPDEMERLRTRRTEVETDSEREERIKRIKIRWAACNTALNEVSDCHGWQLQQILYGVCIENWPIDQLSENDFGMLRTGLNTVSRVLR